VFYYSFCGRYYALGWALGSSVSYGGRILSRSISVVKYFLRKIEAMGVKMMEVVIFVFEKTLFLRFRLNVD